jgi:hypothetical protein
LGDFSDEADEAEKPENLQKMFALQNVPWYNIFGLGVVCCTERVGHPHSLHFEKAFLSCFMNNPHYFHG